jgi:hypothetical protein
MLIWHTRIIINPYLIISPYLSVLCFLFVKNIKDSLQSRNEKEKLLKNCRNLYIQSSYNLSTIEIVVISKSPITRIQVTQCII